MLDLQALNEIHTSLILAVHDENLLRLFLKGGKPLDQAILVGVTAHAGQRNDLRIHLDRLAKKLHLFCALDDAASKRADRLITNEQNGAFLAPQIML